MSSINLASIRKILHQTPQTVRLVAVTKNLEIKQINELLKLGVDTIGENRVQEAARKFPELRFPCEKHMIGHLQTNKVTQALELFDVIESVDSVKLAEKINKEASRTIPILLEVNIAGEEQKYGFQVSELEEALEEIRKLPRVKTLGLMAMVPFTENPEASRPYFREVKKLAEKFKLPEISMGTSQDFEVAIEEGATIIRVGRGLF